MQDWSDRIFQQYTARLVALARSRMQGALQARFDPEDVVMSAWRSFFCGMQGTQFLESEAESLWPLLATLTLRKLSKSRRLHHAAKRGAHETVELSELHDCATLAAKDPDGEELMIAAEWKQKLLSNFEPRDQLVIEMSIEGFLQSEIAKRLSISDRTVRRVLAAARARLSIIAEIPVEPIAVSKPESLPDIVPSLQQISYTDVLLKSLIGSGSFGKVYEADWRPSGNRIAIKFLRKGLWQHASARYQFLQDVNLVARVNHPNVIQYHAWGESPQGGPFIAMEFIDGTSLSQWLMRHHALNEKLAMLLAIASALATVHASGIVHGDLSPVNILVAASNRPVLTDFGFAHSLGLRESRSAIGGTLGFAAPEQVNSAFGEPSTASDCYAWGAIAWYMLVGSPIIAPKEPFAMVFDTLSARPHDFTALNELNLPDGLVRCIRACLDKQTQLRPSATDIAAELNKYADL